MNFSLFLPHRRFECDERPCIARSCCTRSHCRHPLCCRLHRIGDNLSKALAKVREEFFSSNFDFFFQTLQMISIFINTETAQRSWKCENDRHEWQVSGLSIAINVPGDDTRRKRKSFDASRCWRQFDAPKSATDDDGQWKRCNRWRRYWPRCDSKSIWWVKWID